MEVEMVELSAELEVELKYCERCGGLWLRAVGRRQIYCPPCIPKMAKMPFRGMTHRASNFLGHEPDGSGNRVQGTGVEILAFCPEGENA
jgi:Transcription factor zinc-finger